MTVSDLASKDAAAKTARGKRSGEIPVKLPEPSVDLTAHTPANERKQVGSEWALTQQGAKACWKYYKEQGLQIPLVATSPHTTSLVTSGHVVQPADGTATSTVSLTTVGEIISSENPDPPETPFSSSTLWGPALNSAGDIVGQYVADENAGTDYPVQPGRATSFDGVNDALKATITPAVSYPFSIMGWTYIDHNGSAFNLFGVSSDAATNYIDVHLVSGGTRIQVDRNDGTTDTDGMDTNGPLSLNEWHHVAVVFTSATHYTIYIDGFPHFDDNAVASKTPTGLDTVGIGCNWISGSADTPLSGDLFDIRLYDRVMTAAEIYKIMSDPVANLYATDLLGHWRLDDQGEYFDTSGNGNDAVATDSPSNLESADIPASFDNVLGGSIPASTWYPARSDNTALDVQGNSLDTPGPLANRLAIKGSLFCRWDGGNDRLDIGETQPTLSNFSFCAWVYKHDHAGTQGLFSNYDWLNSERGIDIYVAGTSGEVEVDLSPDGSNSSLKLLNTMTENGDTIPLNTWTHVAVTFAPDDLKVYIDGKDCTLEGTNNTANTIHGSNLNCFLGCRQDNGSQTSFYDGDMCDVRVYRRTLSSTEVTDISQGKVGHSGGNEPHWWYPLSEGGDVYVTDVMENSAPEMGYATNGIWTHNATQDVFHYAAMYGSGGCGSASRRGDGAVLQTAPTYQRWRSHPYAEGWYDTVDGTFLQQSTDFLIVAVVKPGTGDGSHTLASRWNNNTNEEWRLYWSATAWRAQFTTDGTTASTILASYTYAHDMAPQMVAFWQDPVAGECKISIDDGTASTGTCAGTHVHNDARFAIGCNIDNQSTKSNELRGELEYVAYFDVSSASVEADAIITALYNSGTFKRYSDLTAQNKTDWGLSNWWQASDLSPDSATWVDAHASKTLNGSDTANTSSSLVKAYDGTDNTWPTLLTDLDFTGGVSSPHSTNNYLGYWACDGTRDGLSVWDALSGVDFSGGTMTVYARLRDMDNTVSNPMAFGLQSNVTNVDRLELFYFPDVSSNMRWRIWSESGALDFGAGYNTPTDGEWHDYVVQINGTSVTGFVDGTQIGTATLNKTLATAASGWTRALLLSAGAGSSSNKYTGDIARLVVSNSIQSPYQMQQDDPTDNVLDLRFDWRRIVDTKGRTDPQSKYTQSGHDVAKMTSPTAYSRGDTLGDGLSKTGEGSFTAVTKDQ